VLACCFFVLYGFRHGRGDDTEAATKRRSGAAGVQLVVCRRARVKMKQPNNKSFGRQCDSMIED
jgi:hypothetical protein